MRAAGAAASEPVFGCERIDSLERLAWWNAHILAGEGGFCPAWGGKSAPWVTRTSGPCVLYICFFAYEGREPCIFVPMYVQEPIAMAQGILRLPRYCPAFRTGPLGVRLLAAACAHFARESPQPWWWLFVSPIGAFRATLLAHMARERVWHCDLGADKLSTTSSKRFMGETWVRYAPHAVPCTDEDDDDEVLVVDRCTLVTTPKTDHRQTSMTWDPARWPVVELDLGVMAACSGDQWSVVGQRWLQCRRRDAAYEAHLRANAPYAMLDSLFGSGILVIGMASLAAAGAI